MSEKRLFITRVILVVVVGTAGAAVSPLLHDSRPALAGVVVAIALVYAATGWLPQRRSE